jgi:predicted TPR repeat methyltransferase
MNCQCQGIEALFDARAVQKELQHYRRKGPAKTTQILIGALNRETTAGRTLLDIGGGLGAIQHALLEAGAAQATSVEASPAYLQAAQEEAGRRGQAGRISYRSGNFVDLAPEIPPADIVTLDRVICCYDDMEKLVALSAERAGTLYGVVYPRDTGWIRLAMRLLNLFFRARRCSYRSFIHPTAAVSQLVESKGLQQVFFHQTLVWQVVVYARP